MFASRHRLQVRRYTEGVPDAHGNVTPGWGAPVDWFVQGVAPGGMAEPFAANRDLSIIEHVVYAAQSDEVPGERDRVLVGGVEFEVDGRPDEYTDGPWPTAIQGGVVVMLRRAEG